MAQAPGLGEFETLLLLAILHLTEQKVDANGSAIRDEIQTRAERHVARGSVYITLDRLEEKGLLTSREIGGSAARGHRPKRVFKVTGRGCSHGQVRRRRRDEDAARPSGRARAFVMSARLWQIVEHRLRPGPAAGIPGFDDRRPR